jgi:hypothetical protein
MAVNYRKLAPFAAAIVLAFVVVAVSRLTDANSAVFYGFAGFVAGILGVAGTAFALWRPVGRERIQDLSGMQPVEPTRVAPQLVGQVAAANLHVQVVFHGLQQDVLGADGPDIVPADGARNVHARACPV